MSRTLKKLLRRERRPRRRSAWLRRRIESALATQNSTNDPFEAEPSMDEIPSYLESYEEDAEGSFELELRRVLDEDEDFVRESHERIVLRAGPGEFPNDSWYLTDDAEEDTCDHLPRVRGTRRRNRKAG